MRLGLAEGCIVGNVVTVSGEKEGESVATNVDVGIAVGSKLLGVNEGGKVEAALPKITFLQVLSQFRSTLQPAR